MPRVIETNLTEEDKKIDRRSGKFFRDLLYNLDL